MTAVVKALEAGTSHVTSLELEDAEWAGDRKYSAALLRCVKWRTEEAILKLDDTIFAFLFLSFWQFRT